MDLMVLAMARKYMDKKVAELVSAGWTKEIVKELPAVGNDKTIYMVEKVDSAGNTYYDEYMYTNGKFDGIGTTRVDLSNYARLDSFNPYKFFINDDGKITINLYDPNNLDTMSGLVEGTLFNELNFRTTILATRVDDNRVQISTLEEDMQRLSSAYIYKGNVNSYSNLPCGDKVLKVRFSQGHYIELSLPDNSIPKDAAKVKINAKSSTGANYNFVLMGTSNKAYNFYIQKDKYTYATVDISNFDYSTSNGKFRITFTATGDNTLEINEICFLNSGGSTIKTIFVAENYVIGTNGPITNTGAISASIAYKNPTQAEEQKETLQIGDVYNVSDSDKNYAWNGTDWDNLGGTFSLTNYQPREDTRLKTTSKYIVGAINELKTLIDNQATEVEATLNAILEGEY